MLKLMRNSNYFSKEVVGELAAQLMIGIAFIIVGLNYLLNRKKYLHKDIDIHVSSSDMKAYQKELSIPYLSIGLICIIMGIAYHYKIVNHIILIILYIILAVLFIINEARINKKYMREIWPW